MSLEQEEKAKNLGCVQPRACETRTADISRRINFERLWK